ncbi:MAG: hypothetical protein H0U52_01245 [Chloroflexi bacterium]|nr:hypothetical protein [Chloroflexota bacterium]
MRLPALAGDRGAPLLARSSRLIHRRPSRSRGRDRRDAGQVLVIFALAITVLFAAAGLAFDIGRFYAERRFLQNAADAAALAAANALIQGKTEAQANLVARAVLAANFSGAPNGVTPALPPTTPQYESGHAGDPLFLTNGILFDGTDVRVAVENAIGYSFGRAVGLTSSMIRGQARARTMANALPIAVRRYVNSPGPATSNDTAPCAVNETQFLDFFATQNSACLGTETNSSLRVEPNAGSAFDSTNPDSDPSNHGPELAILGQGAQPGNGADFRGFIALDIRNFQSATSQFYYNGVTAGTNTNTLKAMEANWITTGGYPGPAFPAAITPPDPNDQVAIMSGNATGIVIDAMVNRYIPGEEILVAVYPGNVMAIPDFAMTSPGTLVLPVGATTPTAGSLKVSRNQAFSGQVTLATIADTLDPANPMVLGTLVGADPITYNPNPVTPSLGGGASVAMTNVTTTATATPGIYALWVRGQAGAPYLTTKLEPFGVQIGTVTRDFTFTSDASSKDAAASGDVVGFTLTLANTPDRNTNFGNPVTLSVDTPLPTGVGPITFGSSTVTPNRNGNSTTLTINTGTMATGSYTFTVRATGMNGDSTSRKVTHLMNLTVRVAPTTSSRDDYVDIVGFAVMRISALDANTVSAYAITPVIADPNDPRLRRGQVAKLVPWT